MKIINNIKDLHGMRSNCNKFTINIEKNYLAVACNFHDKARIVYSESVENMNGILYDLYKVFNFPSIKIVPFENVSTTLVGIEVLIDKEGNAVGKKESGSIKFYDTELFVEYFLTEDWDEFVKDKEEFGYRLVKY
ncbi:MAG: hypothetical protein ACRDBY_01010 [Cetobacterium sp.]